MHPQSRPHRRPLAGNRIRHWRKLGLAAGVALAVIYAAQAQTPPAPPPVTAGTPAMPPTPAPPIPAAPVAAAPAAVPAAAPAAAAAAKGPTARTLLFSPDDIRKIRLALENYESRDEKKEETTGNNAKNETEDFIEQLVADKALKQKTKNKLTSYTYPQFYLSSLVYHSDDDWLVWVNNRKLTPKTPWASSDIRVVALGPRKVRFQWRPEVMEMVTEVWDKVKHPEGMTVDKQRGLVEFTLYPNQTFTSYAMQVVEGKVPMVMRKLDKPVPLPTQAVGGPATPGATPETAVTPDMPSDGKDEEHKGFRGLLGAYDAVGERVKQIK